ncbi:uncharacterized protein AB675_5755 [Cyphellophora attinorum]|uniref:Uncharacterized protein n=1 Tax=Cyphellophora attinorum TaxID=1664694 RepID=A0A0N0NL43_9EURO|nr:uncharacterized protein AB675_5755 [Phialophora attinorum]KPI38748.1 hypothetical protein AB675_5755 [Phialophora attinorum]
MLFRSIFKYLSGAFTACINSFSRSQLELSPALHNEDETKSIGLKRLSSRLSLTSFTTNKSVRTKNSEASLNNPIDPSDLRRHRTRCRRNRQYHLHQRQREQQQQDPQDQEQAPQTPARVASRAVHNRERPLRRRPATIHESAPKDFTGVNDRVYTISARGRFVPSFGILDDA